MTQPRLLGGRYELDGIVGRGGMAEVFRARDIRLDRIVGVKTLRDDLARDQTFQARFRREAQSAASLNHPSIVAVYDTGEDMVGSLPVPYIVMEFVDGRTLRDLLRDDRRLVPERALEITDGVLRALDYSHRNGIVHRDIKPGNVMLTRSGDVKVMDFGIARAVADTQLTMTQTAQVIGTAQYLSPEQARGERVDFRSDLYSTGCLLYELLTGRPPFTGDSPVAIAYQHVKEDPVPPSQVDPEVPRWADAIVLRAMAKDPADRYQSAGEMRNDIQRALSGAPVAMPPGYGTRRISAAQTAVTGRTAAIPPYQYGPPGYDDGTGQGPGYPPPRRRRKAWPWVAVATVVIVLVAVIALLKFVGSGSSGVAVPSVTSADTLAQAEQAIQQSGLDVGKITYQNSDTVAKGDVISTSPGYGATEPKHSPVNIVVSLGTKAAPTVPVPDVTQQSQADATRTLKSQGFKVKVTIASQPQPGTPPDTVISESPVGSSQAKKGSTVTITVTPSDPTVPGDVVGKTQEAATAELSAAPYNYNVNFQTVNGAGQPGTVTEVVPGAGTQLASGSSITIYVLASQAPPSPAPTTPSAPASPTSSPSPDPSPSDSSSPLLGIGGL